ncbi:MAG: hypothetical protein P9L99_13575 [Candidatus Lernaella stagnicola]|nr:hypothetical protein [Candidatus Lernaella stagnicola]
MPFRGAVCALIALLLVAGLPACGGKARPVIDPMESARDGVPSQVIAAEGVRFTTGALPFGWRKLLRGEAKAGFLNEVHGQAIMVNVVYAPNRNAGLVALRNHLLFDLAERRIHEHEMIEVDHRQALWTVARGRLDGAAVQLALVVVRIDDWVYDFAYVSTPENFDVCLGDFRGMLNGFHQSRAYDQPE